MKTIVLSILFVLLLRGVLAQTPTCDPCNGSNSLDISTGLGTNGVLMSNPGLMAGGTLSSPQTGNQVDPFWQLINVPPLSISNLSGISIPNSFTVHAGSFVSVNSLGPANWVNITGADAVSVIPNSSFAANNTVQNQPWRFIRKFYVCQPDPGKSTTHVHFSVDHTGDDGDRVKIFDSNGVLLWTDPSTGWFTNWASSTHFDADLDMHPGCCYLVVELKNTQGGLMGFSVKGNLSVSNNSLTNPAAACCNNLSTISGQKIIDANCDGQFNFADQPGVGWTINLTGASGTQTATTDANGEFTFYNVPNGTYTLQEVSQTGFNPINPASGQFSVVANAASAAVQTFQFFNCPSHTQSPTPTPTATATATPTPTPTPTPTTTPCQCDGTATVNQGAVTVAAQTDVNNSDPVSTATTSFTLNASAPVSEVRMLIDEFRLTTSAGNDNCIVCKNKPQTWANINSASLAGVANQTAGNPSTLQTDVREFVFNNGPGTVFNLNSNTLNLTLGVPGVTGLKCCTLKAEVCIKFIIRDVNCCEREVEKCFTFNLQ